ncbi:MAG: hypothetical protein OEY28_07890, partial [Nitrospira sp.]|nr:hypothetical protein [Nitrospira sp.]
MVQLGQASTNTKEKEASLPAASAPTVSPSPVDGQHDSDMDDGQPPKSSPAKAAQGPALDVPREVLDMLNSRKLDLDRREQEVRQSEERLEMVRVEIEKLLAQNEALEKRLQNERAKESQQVANAKTVQAKALLEKERLASEKKSQLGRMYETMPSEEAA